MRTFTLHYTYRHDRHDYSLQLVAPTLEDAREKFYSTHRNGAYLVFK